MTKTMTRPAVLFAMGIVIALAVSLGGLHSNGTDGTAWAKVGKTSKITMRMYDNMAKHNPPATGCNFIIKWKKVKGAKGYQLKIWSKYSAGDSWRKWPTHYTKKNRFITGYGSDWDDYYKIKVRAYKKKGSKKIYGKWTTKVVRLY